MKFQDEEQKIDLPGTIVNIKKWYRISDSSNFMSNDGQFLALKQMGLIDEVSYITFHIKNMKLHLSKGSLPKTLIVPLDIKY